MPNLERMKRLQQLSPLEAVRAYLNGEFGLGEESALCSAIRKDSRIALSDEEITDAIIEAMGNDSDAETCLERLAAPR